MYVTIGISSLYQMVVHVTSLNSAIHSMYRSIMAAAASERSHLSATAVKYVFVPATRLGSSFDLLVPGPILPPLCICVRPKMFISRAKATTESIIDRTRLVSLLPYSVGALREKFVALRLVSIECLVFVQCFNPSLFLSFIVLTESCH